MSTARPDVLVVGGGLAGLAAATLLVEQGASVVLLEGRGGLGGRAQSFVHQRSGDELDTGQHVLMGCYHEMFAYLDRIGTRHLVRVQSALSVELAATSGERARVSCPRLPAPWHLAVALLRHDMLSWREKLACLRVMRDVRTRCGDPALESVTVTEWLVALGQSERARAALWDPICLACLNASPDVAPASLLAVVMKRAFLGDGDASSIAVSTVSLSALVAGPALRYMRERGGIVRLNEPVRSLVVEAGRCRGAVLRDGSTIEAAMIVGAVPGPALARILPEDVRSTLPFARLDEFGRSPIVSLHLWLDRRVLDVPFVGVVGSQLHWIFDRELIWGVPARSGHLVSLVVSGADEFADMDREQVLARCWAEMKAALPEAREARILDWEVVKEREATFRARPGMAGLRFGPETPVTGLLVAGDWTATGLPATMEGACASGHAAARVALGSPAARA